MKKINQKTRREFLKVEALDPDTGKTFEAMVSYDRLHWIKRLGHGAIKEVAFIVPYVLQRPNGVFEGLCWNKDEDKRGYGWRCYCAVPPHAYAENGDEQPPRPDKIFLAFMNTEHVVYNWRWEKVDPEDNRFPINFKLRFRKPLI